MQTVNKSVNEAIPMNKKPGIESRRSIITSINRQVLTAEKLILLVSQ